MTQTLTSPLAFHAMAKPIGPICNIDCSYCYYLEKEHLYPETRKWRMSDEVLESFIRQYIEQQNVPEINFAWQGGEPTLLGVEFFRNAVALQQKYANGKSIRNALQTNGTLLDDDWGRFLAGNSFLVGLSIDGPRALHDRYRLDRQGQGTFDQMMRGLDVLRRHHVEFNTLTVVGAHNQHAPVDVYRFLKQAGSLFVQFIPLVERSDAGVQLTREGQPLSRRMATLSAPPDCGLERGEQMRAGASVTPWSVDPKAYGEFLCAVFDEWVRLDVGRVFVQLFEVALGRWMNLPPSLCFFAETCGTNVAVEQNGDVFSCDHYVYPQYKLGNFLGDTSLGELVGSPRQHRFGQDKLDSLPEYCRSCDVRFACNGECPKHRFTMTPDGQSGLNYLCPAYKRFFHHIDPVMRRLSALVAAGRPGSEIMGRSANVVVAANDPCPCGSGMKYKRCCGRR